DHGAGDNYSPSESDDSPSSLISLLNPLIYVLSKALSWKMKVLNRAWNK
ncbi:hypothetical protein NPIL_365821, partial [Nephila pilipes]